MAIITWTGCFPFSLGLKDLGIVYPILLEPRGDSGRQVLQINQDITLILQKSEVFLSDFLFTYHSNGEPIHCLMKKEEYEKNLYHDEQSMASVLFDNEDGAKVEGVLSDTLRIKPLPGMSRSDDSRIPHALYEIELPPTTKEGHRQRRTGYHEHHENPPSQNFSAERRDAQQASGAGSLPDVIFPEIYIVVDTMFASVFWWDEMAITSYLAVFLNAVNLRFKSLRHPNIKLRLVGITVSMENEPYLAKTRSGHILDDITLKNFKNYYKGKIEYEKSDLLYLLTGRDMAFYNGDVLETWVGGYAYIGGMCKEQKVAMSEDRAPSFYGVSVFAHEVGHTLGCADDGSPASIPGLMGAVKCPGSDGYLMSHTRKGENKYRFSKCCRDDMKLFARMDSSKCLTQTMFKKHIVNTGLPGSHTTQEEFCRRVYPYVLGVHYDKEYGVQNCRVRCQNATDRYTISVVDGTPCDVSKDVREACLPSPQPYRHIMQLREQTKKFRNSAKTKRLTAIGLSPFV